MAAVDDLEHVLRTIRTPRKLRILLAIRDAGEASPAELAERFGWKLGDVSYHVRQLAEHGAIVETRTRPVRGALQHFYAPAPDLADVLERLEV